MTAPQRELHSFIAHRQSSLGAGWIRLLDFLPREKTGMATRKAGKAGSWYVASPDELNSELDDYLSKVPGAIDGASLPISGARIVIAP